MGGIDCVPLVLRAAQEAKLQEPRSLGSLYITLSPMGLEDVFRATFDEKTVHSDENGVLTAGRLLIAGKFLGAIVSRRATSINVPLHARGIAAVPGLPPGTQQQFLTVKAISLCAHRPTYPGAAIGSFSTAEGLVTHKGPGKRVDRVSPT